jgi:hypothetical protein
LHITLLFHCDQVKFAQVYNRSLLDFTRYTYFK